ncbi:unnamed protein product [Prorocentrum cordatum]|uniref:Uncharacterized protein n=1 Tax=Prorocentrum cordatum TaxID=2364126 RepID=A0ABN9ULZ0_9DINO|nr:unnamed protein product [Polarella glacialis]
MGKVTECNSGHKLKESGKPEQARATDATSSSETGRWSWIAGRHGGGLRVRRLLQRPKHALGGAGEPGALLHTDPRGAAPASEVVTADCEPEASAAAEDPRCNRRRQGQAQGTQRAEAPRAPPGGRRRGAGPEAPAPEQEPVDLLGGDPAAPLAGAGQPWGTMDYLDSQPTTALECAAPPDLDLLGSKGWAGPQGAVAAARMGSA